MDGPSLNMYNIEIESKFGTYSILIKPIVEKISSDYYDVIIVDSNLKEHLVKYSQNYEFVSVSESKKSLDGVSEILTIFVNHNLNRKSNILVVGGGILQDLATLASSIYMRGLKWDYAPTTLMAMGDSCVGGKSSINFNNKKNILGNFYPPSNIFIDTSFIETLDNSQVISGLSEIIKILYVQNPKLDLANKDSLFERESHFNFDELIYLSLYAKKQIIEQDEFDNGARLLLNFGHTYGHALESSSNFLFPHGVAVAVGMLAACFSEYSEVSNESKQLKQILIDLLLPIRTELNLWAKNIDWTRFSESINFDKKGTANTIALILPSENGWVKFIEVKKSPENLLHIENNMKYALELAINGN